MAPWIARTVFLACALALAGCAPTATTPAPAAPAAPTQYTYEVVHAYPHNPDAFTEGLVFINGKLYESTGLNGHSTLREEELETGKVLRNLDIPAEYFGEGLAILNGKAYQLTWQTQKGFVYDLPTFNLINSFTYTGEGWGLTTDGHSLIMSDGTSTIRFLDPATFAVQRTITVKNQGVPVTQVNELEYIKGIIYANVWQTNNIILIDPQTGDVRGVADFSGLLPLEDRANHPDVLNGIAYDPATDRIFVTGKLWPKLFEVKLKPVATSAPR